MAATTALAPRPDERRQSREARPADDSRHSVLSKARSVSQTGLDAFVESHAGREGALLPRDAFGTFHVKEVDVKSALTECAMPGRPWSLNPYTGCSHACVYCYVPDVAHVEREKWGAYVIVKRNLPTLLARELRRKAPRDVFLSSATDPYQPAEAQHKVTRRCLEQLARVDWPLRVLTRNPLVRRDVDVLSRFSDVAVGMSVPTLDDRARALIEPAAPPIEGRLRALRDLADAGLPTFANIAPAYPLTGDVKPADVARAFRDARVGTVYAAPWRYLQGVLPVLSERVAGTDYAVFERAVTDAAYYKRLFTAIAGACRREGVDFRVMRG